jgi:hypothetical protein
VCLTSHYLKAGKRPSPAPSSIVAKAVCPIQHQGARRVAEDGAGVWQKNTHLQTCCTRALSVAVVCWSGA